MNVEVKNMVKVSAQEINMDVKFEGTEEFLPFTATPYDDMDYGRELYKKAVRGDFGNVSS